ncbi:MAG: hypothetical protein H7122_06395 [Chitinophagaceae bacterium]|nr:hypothetical protein [Chitinophagaceae bacterium]
MKRIFLLLAGWLFAIYSVAQNIVPSSEIQIKTALLSAPADKRDSTTVYGYSDNKEFILLKKGFNELICIADDPAQAAFSVACYHKDLQPFMERGRDLRKQGKSGQEIFAIREKEVKAGGLRMPKMPSTLFVYTATDSNYNRLTGEVKNGYLRYVIYIPYATAESTGLPLKPSGAAMPWIMHPGTHGAHIMINPPVK